MKYIFTSFLFTFISYQTTFADNLWILWNASCSWAGTKEFRNGNIQLDAIPCLIQSTTNFLLGVAGTISVVFIIIWAYKILFGSLTQDTTKWKDTIISALIWFALASLSWFIVKLVLDNFTNL